MTNSPNRESSLSVQTGDMSLALLSQQASMMRQEHNAVLAPWDAMQLNAQHYADLLQRLMPASINNRLLNQSLQEFPASRHQNALFEVLNMSLRTNMARLPSHYVNISRLTDTLLFQRARFLSSLNNNQRMPQWGQLQEAQCIFHSSNAFGLQHVQRQQQHHAYQFRSHHDPITLGDMLYQGRGPLLKQQHQSTPLTLSAASNAPLEPPRVEESSLAASICLPTKLTKIRNRNDLNSVAVASGKRGMLEPFPEKLHRLLTEVEAAGHSDVISFVQDGKAFSIHKPDKFFLEIVPAYFQQSHLSSFKRQLNLYGFELIARGPSRGAYFHASFEKDRAELCRHIRRRDVKFETHPKSSQLNTKAPNFYTSLPPITRKSDKTVQETSGSLGTPVNAEEADT